MWVRLTPLTTKNVKIIIILIPLEIQFTVPHFLSKFCRTHPSGVKASLVNLHDCLRPESHGLEAQSCFPGHRILLHFSLSQPPTLCHFLGSSLGLCGF